MISWKTEMITLLSGGKLTLTSPLNKPKDPYDS